MDQIARHIAAVRWRKTLEQLLLALSYGAIFVAVFVIVVLLMGWIVSISIPHFALAIAVLSAASLAGAVAYSSRRRISQSRAAAMIDQRLGLKERLSTAVSINHLNGDFVQAVLADAEECASNVDLRGKFPIRIPRALYVAAAAVLIAIASWWLIPKTLAATHQASQQAANNPQASQKILADAVEKIKAQTKTFAGDSQIQQAKRDLEKELSSPPKDPAQARRDAAKAMQKVAEAASQHSAQSQAANQAQKDALQQIKSPKNETGNVADAQNALARADPHRAEQAIAKTAQQSKQQTQTQRQQTARQLQEMASQLKQAAQNQQTQQTLSNQLQQMGFNSQQIQQMKNQPASKLRQMIGQFHPNLSSQQQQQAARLMQRMSADAHTRQQMQAMSKSAQQMAQAMAQNNPQQAAAAAKSMQQQLNQMQAQQQSAQQQSAEAQSAQQSANQSMQTLNQNGQPSQQAGPGKSSSGPPIASGQSPNTGGTSGVGHEHAPLTMSPPSNQPAFSIKIETPPPGQNIPGGKVLADFLVKGDVVKGQAEQQLQNIVAATRQQSAEDADQESIDAGARQTVKKYFQAMQDNK